MHVLWLILLLLLPIEGMTKPSYGILASYPIIAKEPPDLKGYQFMISYDPDRFHWRQFNVYFDGGFSHFWINATPCYTTLNIVSLAPVIRYTFKKHWFLHPFLEFSIGLAYLNHTHLEDRNLGMHFSFQDRFGVGAHLGQNESWSLSLHAVHYSNAHLCNHNSGVSIPLTLDVGYRFQ